MITEEDGAAIVNTTNGPTFSENKRHLELRDISHYYAGNYPYGMRHGINANTQGITHDDQYWYITQETRIWKIDATLPLAGDIYHCGDVGVLCRDLSDTILSQDGYNHFGDLSYFNGYLAVATTGGSDLFTHIAFFRATDLFMVKSVALTDLSKGESGGFVAVDNDGFAYASENHASSLSRYYVDWDAMDSMEGFTKVSDVVLYDRDGNSLLLHHMQGGAFSDEGLLYLTNGYIDQRYDPDGILVFELTGCTGICAKTLIAEAHEVARSTNSEGPFNFEFHPNWWDAEEPEGVTYWDLTDPRAPAVPGETDWGPIANTQLHALMVNNGAWDSRDKVYLKHYRHTAGSPVCRGFFGACNSNADCCGGFCVELHNYFIFSWFFSDGFCLW